MVGHAHAHNKHTTANRASVGRGRALRPFPVNSPPRGGRRLGVHRARAVRSTSVVQLYHAHYIITFTSRTLPLSHLLVGPHIYPTSTHCVVPVRWRRCANRNPRTEPAIPASICLGSPVSVPCPAEANRNQGLLATLPCHLSTVVAEASATAVTPPSPHSNP